MNVLRAIVRELYHLFVDDGALAFLSAVLVALIAAAVKLWTMPPLLGAGLLVVGSVAILADSVRRLAHRRR